VLSAEVEAKLRKQGLDPETMTLDDLYPEALDQEGNDLSLMTWHELDIWVTYCRTRYYLAEKYPLPREENQPGQQQAQASSWALQINIDKAKEDPKSKIYLEALEKVFKIYGKLEA
jgi:hypothetical protein